MLENIFNKIVSFFTVIFGSSTVAYDIVVCMLAIAVLSIVVCIAKKLFKAAMAIFICFIVIYLIQKYCPGLTFC